MPKAELDWKFRIDGADYIWSGGIGAILKSYEKGIRRGDTRVIGDHLFYAYYIGPSFLGLFKREIWWSIPNVDYNTVREIKKEFF